MFVAFPDLACARNKYLVSGPLGVADDKLTASSFFTLNGNDLAARNARLNSTHLSGGSWSPAAQSTILQYRNQFVQVTNLYHKIDITETIGGLDLHLL